MKKMLSIILAVLIVVTAIPFTAMSVLGASSDEYTYTVDETMTAITIDKYNGNDTVVNIPSEIDGYTVKKIAQGAFSGNETIEKVVIPDTVETIAAYAFSSCKNLSEIIIPDTVITIGKTAFDGTVPEKNFLESDEGVFYVGNHLIKAKSDISNLEIPEGTKSIASSALHQCKSLTSVVVPDGVVSIGSYAFAHCEALSSITLPDTLRHIGKSAFFYTAYYNNKENWVNALHVHEVDGVNNNLYIGKNLIKANGTTSDGGYSVRGDTKCIADYAFAEGKQTEIFVPNSVRAIGISAFENCTQLTKVTLEYNLKYIGNDAFKNCTALQTLKFNGAAGYWAAIEFGNIYSNPMYYATEETFKSGNIADVVLPDSIKKIHHYAFYNCDTLTGIDLGDSIEEIGYLAFYNCKSLNDLEIPWTVEYIGYNAFFGCENLETFGFGGNADDWVRIKLENVFSNPMYFAKQEYFENNLIEDVVIYKDIEAINKFTFNRCDSITSITFPASLKKIENSAFYACENLKDVYFRGTENEWNAVHIGMENYPITNNTVHYNCTPPVADESDFTYWIDVNGVVITGYNGTLQSFAIPETIEGVNVLKIEADAFTEKDIVEVIIPDTVVTIGDCAFANCVKLRSVQLPASLELIGVEAFAYCDSLGSIEIPEGTMMIYEGAFSLCTALKYVTLPSTISNIDMYTFEYCTALKSITIPEGVKTIDSIAFLDCYALETVYLPNTIESISADAFNNTSLKDVYYNGTEAEWADVTARFESSVKVHFLAVEETPDVPDTPIIPEGAALSIGSADAMVGETITLPVTLEKVELGTLSYTITYDSSKLKFVSIDDIAFDMYDTNTATDGKIVVVATNNAIASTGVIANVTFEVIATDDCTADVNVVINESYNGDDVAVEVSAVNGTVAIKLYVSGDATGDGELTTLDARYVLQAAAGNRVLSEKEAKAADVNGDGQVSAIDARWILQAVAGNRVL